MELELKKECLDTYELGEPQTLTQEETAETIVPDYCPDIARIVDTAGQLTIREKLLSESRCTVSGSVKVTVLCGLPKGDKTDYIIQKSVEAGAEEILFFNSDRCVARPDKPEKKLERWQRIAEEAAKQSGRGIIPQVGWAGDFAGALDVAVKKELGLFMYETGEREALNDVLGANSGIASAAIITGPEGGFAQFEADLARIAGLHICSMGERILRCETAPVVALTAVMYATGNLS